MKIGMLALLGFALLSAARDVLAHELFKDQTNRVDPVLFTFIICLATFIVFYVRACIRDRRPYRMGDFRASPATARYIAYLSVGTLVAYLTTFLAIDLIDAYSNSLIDYGASPLVTAALAVVVLRERLARGTVGAMICCLLGIGVLTFSMAPPSASVSTTVPYLLGMGFATVSCVAASLNNLWNKRLVDAGIRREKAIALRMPLAIVALGSWLLIAPPPLPVGATLWIQLIAMSVLGVSVPLFLVVVAFESLKLQSFAFAMFLIPVFAYVGSLMAGHVEFSPWSSAAGLMVLIGVLWSEAPAHRMLSLNEKRAAPIGGIAPSAQMPAKSTTT